MCYIPYASVSVKERNHICEGLIWKDNQLTLSSLNGTGGSNSL